MRSRREFLQFAVASAGVFSAYPSFTAAAARQQLTQDDLLSVDAKGPVTRLHLTDIPGQLKPIYFRPPSIETSTRVILPRPDQARPRS